MRVQVPLRPNILPTSTNILSHEMPNHVIVDYYRLSLSKAGDSSFQDVFTAISKLEIINRIFQDRTYPIWLHEFSIEDQYINGDIVRLRMQDLPTKGNLDGIIQDLNFADNEGIAEHTAFFYHKDTQVLLLQKVQGGVDIGRFCNYFEQLSKNDYKDLQIIDVPLVEEQVIKRLRKGDVTEIEAKVAIPSNPIFFKEDHHSVEQYMRNAIELNANEFEFKFSVGRKKKQSLDYWDILDVINTLLRLNGANPGSVKKLRSKILIEGETRNTALDLLNARMKATIPMDFNSRSRVIPYVARKDAMKEAWQKRSFEIEKMYPIL